MSGSISSIGGGMNSFALKQMQEELFKAGDKNGDGTISKDELSQVAKSGNNQDNTSVDDMFSQLDSNSDGAISRLESDAAIAKMGQEMQSQGARPQGPPPGAPPAKGGDKTSDSSQDSDAATIFDAMDTNKDGTVSLVELTAALDTSKSDSTSSADPESLLNNLSTALESGDISAAREALTALQNEVSSRNNGQGNDPFSEDLQSLASALESGNLSDAQDVFAGIQEKLSALPPHRQAMENTQNQGNNTQDAVAKTLQALLDAVDESSSATSATITNDSLKSILTTALNSYKQQSTNSYEQGSVSGSILTATA